MPHKQEGDGSNAEQAESLVELLRSGDVAKVGLNIAGDFLKLAREGMVPSCCLRDGGARLEDRLQLDLCIRDLRDLLRFLCEELGEQGHSIARRRLAGALEQLPPESAKAALVARETEKERTLVHMAVQNGHV